MNSQTSAEDDVIEAVDANQGRGRAQRMLSNELNLHPTLNPERVGGCNGTPNPKS